MRKIYSVFLLTICLIPGYTLTVCGQAFNELQYRSTSFLRGQGKTGTAVLTDDAFAFTVNPAQLGAWSKTNNFSFSAGAAGEDLLRKPDFGEFGLAAGLNFEHVLDDVDISVGLGFVNMSRNKGGYEISHGPPDQIDFYTTTEDLLKIYSIGVGIHSFVDLSIGLTLSHTLSRHPANPGLMNYVKTDVTANYLDYGALLTAPLHKYLLPKEILLGDTKFMPVLNTSIGVARLNQGDEVDMGIYEIYPAPRMAVLGYSVNFGSDINLRHQLFQIFSITWTTEAQSYLFDRNSNFNRRDISYSDGLGGISVIRNLIERKGDDDIVVRHGFGIELGEMLTISRGSYSGGGDTKYNTYGVAIAGSGIVKLINYWIKSPTLDYLARHIDIRFVQSNIDCAACTGSTVSNSVFFQIRGFSFDHGFKLF